MRLRYKKLIIFFTLAIMLIGMGTFSIVAPNVEFGIGKSLSGTKNATSGSIFSMSDSDVESAITTLIKDYFTAKQSVDMDALSECVSDISNVDEKRLVTEAEYIEKYKNIECTILNDGLDEGCYRVYVYSEAKIYDIDTLVPSLAALYVVADDNGKFTIYLSSIDQKAKKAIDKLDNSDMVKKKIDTVQKKLEDIVSKNADVRDFYQMLESSSESAVDSTEDNTNTEQEGTAATPVPEVTPAPTATPAPAAAGN